VECLAALLRIRRQETTMIEEEMVGIALHVPFESSQCLS
jgi:hypothetical protein